MNFKHAVLVLPLLIGATGWCADLCNSGKKQSPINISATTVKDLPPLQFDYRSAPLKVANDGHTLRIRRDGSGELHIGTQRYRLQQFHFHTPGGDQIAGEQFPMVVHLLHKSAAGQLLAISVLVRQGAENATMETLLPRIPSKVDGDHLHGGVMVDARSMLPKERGYYRYSGSLTATPCTEGVDWIVMKTPIEISANQLALYKKTFADNARAPQPLNQRVVLESR